MNDRILDLTEIAKRDSVKLPTKGRTTGKLYELRNGRELSAIEYETVVGALEQIEGLDESGGVAALRALTTTLGAALKILFLDMPQTVIDGLGPVNMGEIIGYWLSRQGGDEGNAPASRPTGDASSPGSKSSTAARPKAGSTSPSGS